MHTLSKSSYMRGRQCPKALYLARNRRELMAPITEHQQAIFDQGTSVGELARQLFPGGLDCTADDHRDHGPALLRTQQALLTHDVIYEAAFQHNGVLAVMDIMVREEGGWRAVEVKSSTAVKKAFVDDAALQYHVITGTGLTLNSISIMHLNTAYVRSGAIDLEALFKIQDVTGQSLLSQEEVTCTITALEQMLSVGIEPVREIGPHCDSPYSCSFKPHCWKDIPVPSVLDLTRGRERGFELLAQGVVRLEDIPPGSPLTSRQQLQVAVQRSGIPVIDPIPIRDFLSQLEYPIHCLDLETFASAVPFYNGVHPFQAIPFQYSVHVIAGPGQEPTHQEYLHDRRDDPRTDFLQHLLTAIGPAGTVLAYNLSFERTILARLAHDFPGYRPAIEKILTRCKDLAIPFAQQWYCDPRMNGRYSIKLVLPALAPEFSYKNMPIGDGMLASMLYTRFAGELSVGDEAQWRLNMLEYCKMDTLAMVKLLQVLEQV